MIQTKLKGMGVALITPFKEDESVDYDALIRMVDYLLQNNADFLCVLGTTAETPTLTEEEKKTIKKMVIDRVNGRIPILLGVGGNNTRAIVETLKNDDFTGVDAILSVVPYYNKPSQEGIYQHYKAIAEATELPIVLYNVPGRTGVNMTAETTLRIARDFKNVVAIKEASGNISAVAKLASLANGCIDIYSGNDDQIVPIVALGGKGVISVLSNCMPFETHEITQLCLDGKYEEAREKVFKTLGFAKALFSDVNPIPVKEALNLMGFEVGECRLPLVRMSDDKIEKLKASMNALGLIK